jgi:WD40 repeat protein
MFICPVCEFTFADDTPVPPVCPDCGARLPAMPASGPNSESEGIAETKSASALPNADQHQQTIAEGDITGAAEGAAPAEGPVDRTIISDEWDVPPASGNDQTVQSGDASPAGMQTDAASANESDDSGRTMISDEFPPPAPADADDSAKTMISDEFPAAPENESNAKTVMSEDFGDDPNLKTMLSDEHSGQTDDPSVMKTMMSEEFDDAPNSKTVMSEDFGPEPSSPEQTTDRTIISDQWENDESGATMISDEIPDETGKVMKTMWGGAFAAKAKLGMTLKGASFGGKDEGKSTLVIKSRTLAAPSDQSRPATSDIEYLLVKVLGEGGMGVVYDAVQTSVDRSVAVKMLKPNTAGDERQRQKFLAEAVVTGDLDHPNIVPIYDVGSNQRGLLFYSMKKVKGTPWMKLVNQKSQAENLEILMKTADAIAFAHNRGVIHRDLKPENIMLGDFGEVLVMDWGLALPAAHFGKHAIVSQSQSMGGTPAYMAPEMASGPIEKISFASDIYLLGAILYEILTGKPPHTGKNTMQCLFAAAKNEIRPTDKTGELMDIALKAMATDPGERYPSVREFQEAIRQYQSHTESIALSTRAVEELEQAEATNEYRDFARALFGFEEAFALWNGNTRAEAGLREAKLKYADSAYRKGDFDLGLSLLDLSIPEHVGLHTQIRTAQQEREARQHRLKTMKRVAAAMGAGVTIVILVALVLINQAREQAVIAEQDAKTERDNALKAQEQERLAKQKAVEQEQLALKAKEKEEYEAYIARIGLAAAKIDENAFGGAREILEACKPELRNWEWGRLMHLCEQSVRAYETGAPIDAVAFAPDGKRFAVGSWKQEAQIWETDSGRLLHRLPHEGLYLYAVAFSPDGKWLATGGNSPNAFVQIWNAETGAHVRTITGHTDAVVGLAFSANGKRLATASYDKTARLWDLETGRAVQQFVGHSWWVWSVAFSPDQSRLVTTSQDGTAILWNVSTGERISQFLGHEGPVYSCSFSHNGSLVATGGYDKRVLLWNPDEVQPFDYRAVAAGQKIAPPKFVALDGHGSAVRAVEFSKDGRLVLSGSHDNTVKVWDVETAHAIKTFRGHDSWVRACAFSPDGRLVLSGSHDTRARTWGITDYEEIRVLQGKVLRGHYDAVLNASFSHKDDRIVTASRDRTARTWDFHSGQQLKSFEEGHAFLASSAVFFPNGKRLATGAVDNTTRIWDVSSGTELKRLDRTGRAAAVALSRDGRYLLTGSDERTAKLWDAETGELRHTLVGHHAEVTAVAFSPDASVLFTGDSNGRGILWNADGTTQLHRLQSHSRRITGAIFLSDGKTLLTSSNDKTVARWDVASGREDVRQILKHPDAVLSLARVPGDKRVLTGCADGAVRVWDLERATVITTLPAREMANYVAVSHDGTLALTAHSEERIVRLWDLATGREILLPATEGGRRPAAFLDFNQRGGLVWGAVFSPDDNSVLTVGGSDARLWNRETAEERITFSPHGIVAAASFSPDGKRIVTGSWDFSAKVWNVETGHAELKLEGEHTAYVNSAVFSPDGEFILTAGDDGLVVLWESHTGKSVRRYEGHKGRVRAAIFSPNGRQILTASSDKTARLWEVESGRESTRFEGHTWGVVSVAFASDGGRIITGSEDNTARIWNVADGKVLLTLEGHTAGVTSVAFLADGKRVLTGSQDNSAKLWDVDPINTRDKTTATEILTLKGHSQEVTTVNVSHNGRYVITGSRDGSAIVWLSVDWKTGSEPLVKTTTAQR